MADTRIFISHSHKDRDLAKALEELLLRALRLETTEIFRSSGARAGIPAGEFILPGLIERIRKSDVFLALLTNKTRNSRHVLVECGAALTKEDKPILLSARGFDPNPEPNGVF